MALKGLNRHENMYFSFCCIRSRVPDLAKSRSRALLINFFWTVCYLLLGCLSLNTPSSVLLLFCFHLLHLFSALRLFLSITSYIHSGKHGEISFTQTLSRSSPIFNLIENTIGLDVQPVLQQRPLPPQSRRPSSPGRACQRLLTQHKPVSYQTLF